MAWYGSAEVKKSMATMRRMAKGSGAGGRGVAGPVGGRREADTGT